MKRAAAAEGVDVEPFFPPQVEVIVARRKTKSTWHIVTLRAHQTRPDRSGVSTSDEHRLASEGSGVKAIQQLSEFSRARSAMAVEPPGDGSSMFCAVCPAHGAVHSNSTIDYAIESAYWHALNEHDNLAL